MSTDTPPTPPTVQAGSFLTLHYRLARPDGADLVNTFNESPATLSLGSGELAPGIEARLLGMPEGSRVTIELAPEEAFGPRNPDMLQRVSLALLREREPDLEVDGEMQGDTAVDPVLRASLMVDSALTGEANLLVFPNLDAANISYNLLKATAGNNIAIGPILLGAAKPVHILTASSTVRRIVNMTALTVAEANAQSIGA
ncbi:NADP-dependent malic enzyme [mine drainage metagenome]|uniref:NADP-dependent malic enzyme n=1 Tax=mine drainage metagenome TaxID=410659 RepID=A0A1J5P4F6_9ZZZZ